MSDDDFRLPPQAIDKLLFAGREAARLHDITRGRVSKPHTAARDVLGEHEAVCWVDHENEIRRLQAFIHRLAAVHHIPEILCEDICEVVCAGPCEGRAVGPLTTEGDDHEGDDG